MAEMQGEKVTRVLRFGEFELDVQSGGLYQDGRIVQLQEQPLRILKLLLENPGELVTREEIRKLPWPNGTIVEFVNSVNAAVKKLWNALGDTADEPRYIETVKGRGYRLIVRVETPADLETEPSSAGLANDSSTGGGPSTPGPDLAGQRISHYRVLDLIGMGGWALCIGRKPAGCGGTWL